MIRSVKPPPKVNPHGPSRDPPADPSDSSYRNYPPQEDRVRPPMDHAPATNNSIEKFDFEAAVQEEMRKMELELQEELRRQDAVDNGSSSLYSDTSQPYDIFEKPMPALEKDSPIKLSVADGPREPMFHNRALDEVIGETSADIVSPGRRKGGAIANLHGEKDNRMNQKAARAAEYAAFLQKQVSDIVYNASVEENVYTI